MDTVSAVVVALRQGSPRSQRVQWHAPWGQRFARVPGSAGFQVVLEGTCWLLRDDADPLRLQSGDVLFFPHGSEHALADTPTSVLASACEPGRVGAGGRPDGGITETESPSGERVVTLCGAYELDRRLAHPMLATLPEVVHLRPRVGRPAAWEDAIQLLGAEADAAGPGSDVLVPGLLDVLFVYLLRACLDEPGTGSAGWAAALRDPGISAALDTFHADPGRSWTVASLARSASMSRTTFSRRFGALLGQAPMTYVTWWRMSLAEQLLTGTNLPLRAIASRLGYASEYAFAHAFRRERGSSPGANRRRAARTVRSDEQPRGSVTP